MAQYTHELPSGVLRAACWGGERCVAYFVAGEEIAATAAKYSGGVSLGLVRFRAQMRTALPQGRTYDELMAGAPAACRYLADPDELVLSWPTGETLELQRVRDWDGEFFALELASLDAAALADSIAELCDLLAGLAQGSASALDWIQPVADAAPVLGWAQFARLRTVAAICQQIRGEAVRSRERLEAAAANQADPMAAFLGAPLGSE